MAAQCSCGSGHPRYILYDARGIPCGYVCTVCEAKAKAHYRPEIFTDADYWTDEPIDEE